VRFGIGGTEYEIDLSKKNAAAFRGKLAPFIEHARKAGRGQRRRPGRTSASRERSGGIRAWAIDRGIVVSDRGRIPASVVEQYEEPGLNKVSSNQSVHGWWETTAGGKPPLRLPHWSGRLAHERGKR
jgi:hypothetical protein